MKIRQLLKLSHADFAARKKTIAFSLLGAGLIFVILLTINFLANGAERIIMHESGKISEPVYLLLGLNTDSAGAAKRALATSLANGGELVAQVAPEQFPEDGDLSTLEILANLADFDLSKATIKPNQSFIEHDGIEELFQDFHVADLFFGGKVANYSPDSLGNYEPLNQAAATRPITLVRFPDPANAYKTYQTLSEERRSFPAIELLNNSYNSYIRFHTSDGLTTLLQVAFLIIAGVIAIGTYVYLLDQSMHSIVVYRALGANTFDLIIISLGYIIEVSLTLLLYVFLASLLIALIVSGLDASYLTKLLTDFYGFTPSNTLMIGFNMDTLWIILTILLTAPLSVLLTLDQFSIKRLSQKLKQD